MFFSSRPWRFFSVQVNLCDKYLIIEACLGSYYENISCRPFLNGTRAIILLVPPSFVRCNSCKMRLCIVFFSMHLVELLQALEHFVQKRSSYSIYAVVKFRKIELL